MEHVVVGAFAFVVSGLTLFSGFGLGTVLLPVFALFFSVEVAVAATALVHGANNVLKVSLVGKGADWPIVLRFGIPAVLAAFAGAALLGAVSGMAPIAEYHLGSRNAVITPVKLVMGVLMVIFALFELLPRLRSLEFDRGLLTLGGLLSGFFGGLSGHQGALRSAFLAKAGITTEAFVGTTAVVSLLVDAVRIAVYAMTLAGAGSAFDMQGEVAQLVLTGIAAAFLGMLIAKNFIEAVTMRAIQTLTGVMLLGIAVALGAGVI